MSENREAFVRSLPKPVSVRTPHQRLSIFQVTKSQNSTRRGIAGTRRTRAHLEAGVGASVCRVAEPPALRAWRLRAALRVGNQQRSAGGCWEDAQRKRTLSPAEVLRRRRRRADFLIMPSELNIQDERKKTVTDRTRPPLLGSDVSPPCCILMRSTCSI